jgi:hypothetical protein
LKLYSRPACLSIHKFGTAQAFCAVYFFGGKEWL